MDDDGVDGISDGADGHSDDDGVPLARPARAAVACRAVPVVDRGGPVLFALLASTDADTNFKGVCDNRVTPLLNFADPVTILVGFFVVQWELRTTAQIQETSPLWLVLQALLRRGVRKSRGHVGFFLWRILDVAFLQNEEAPPQGVEFLISFAKTLDAQHVNAADQWETQNVGDIFLPGKGNTISQLITSSITKLPLILLSK
jgi:hypothetical protein